MYPGTDFPGNDLYSTAAASPEDCAARCVADARCKAFTFSIGARQCMIKWAPSRFDGSLSAVSGVVESRPIVPPSAMVAPPMANLQGGPPPACAARGNDVCAGCSITCAAGQQAVCREGEVHQGISPTCWTKAVCECRGSAAAPPSVLSPAAAGGGGANTCVERDRFGCRGCSASCGPNEKAICSPSIPGQGDACTQQAWCRCEAR